MGAPIQVIIELLRGLAQNQLSSLLFLAEKLKELWESLVFISLIGGFWVAVFVSLLLATIIVLAFKFTKSTLRLLLILLSLLVLLILLSTLG